MTELAGWENFYVIVGSSAGALIGLQFVVITLIAAKPTIIRNQYFNRGEDFRRGGGGGGGSMAKRIEKFV